MKWPNVLLALVRCELKARYYGFAWQVSAKGALPVVMVVVWRWCFGRDNEAMHGHENWA